MAIFDYFNKIVKRFCIQDNKLTDTVWSAESGSDSRCSSGSTDRSGTTSSCLNKI